MLSVCHCFFYSSNATLGLWFVLPHVLWSYCLVFQAFPFETKPLTVPIFFLLINIQFVPCHFIMYPSIFKPFHLKLGHLPSLKGWFQLCFRTFHVIIYYSIVLFILSFPWSISTPASIYLISATFHFVNLWCTFFSTLFHLEFVQTLLISLFLFFFFSLFVRAAKEMKKAETRK